MRCVEKGHVYLLDHIDGDNHQKLTFVNRGNGNDHEGTQCQEVIRVLIDRVKFLEGQVHWRRNDEIINHLRMALVLFEQRAIERKTEKGILKPEFLETGDDGHFVYKNQEHI